MIDLKWEIAISIVLFFMLIGLVNFTNPTITKKTNEVNAEGSQQAGDRGETIPTDGDKLTLPEETPKKEETVPTYKLTNEERNLIERVVMGMAEHEDMTTQKAIAQCILNACLTMKKRPDYILNVLRYPSYRPNPSNEVKQSVSAIFDDGETILDNTVIYLYSPLQTNSQWHETQKYVCTMGSYRFFEEY